MSRRFQVLVAALTATGLVAAGGCKVLETRAGQGAAIGAATGAAVGAVIGKQTGSTVRGAIIGAGIGGVAGSIIGHQMDQKAKEIAGSVPGATITRVGEGLVVTFESGLLFDFDSDRLRDEAKRNLNNLAESLSKFGDSKLLLVGHTDALGSTQYNHDLSHRRAVAVASYLVSRGVPSMRIESKGLGEAEPIASNETEAGRQENRRVEVAIFAGDKMKADAQAQAARSN